MHHQLLMISFVDRGLNKAILSNSSKLFGYWLRWMVRWSGQEYPESKYPGDAGLNGSKTMRSKSLASNYLAVRMAIVRLFTVAGWRNKLKKKVFSWCYKLDNSKTGPKTLKRWRQFKIVPEQFPKHHAVAPHIRFCWKGERGRAYQLHSDSLECNRTICETRGRFEW